jgi:AcrR family transcriptional regulator
VPKLEAAGPTVNALSPNQIAKRQQILDAAQRVILRGGPIQCTTREVARESGLNQGLIYYYFTSIEEIVDAAMMAFTDELGAAITKPHLLTEHRTDGIDALVRDYLEVFQETPGLHLAYFEYWVMSTRAGRLDNLDKVYDIVLERLTGALVDIGSDAPETRARVLVSYIVGTLVRSFTAPGLLDELGSEIANLIPDGSVGAPGRPPG